MIRRNFFKAAAAFFSFPFLWKAKDPLPWSKMTMPKAGRECVPGSWLRLRYAAGSDAKWSTRWEIVDPDGTVTHVEVDDIKLLQGDQAEGLLSFQSRIAMHKK